jgi:hypothetical protein
MGLVRPSRIEMEKIDHFILGELTKGRMPGSEGDSAATGDGNGAGGAEGPAGATPGFFGGRGRMFQRRFVYLTVATTDGEEYDIERRQARSGDNLQTIGRELAEFCERPLEHAS